MATISYDSAISACEKSMYGKLGLELLKESKARTMLNTISHNAAISACEEGKQVVTRESPGALLGNGAAMIRVLA